MPLSRFRVRFDVPYSFAVEPGFERFTHAQDFRPGRGDLAGCYRDPETGLVMLEPSWITEAFSDPSQWKDPSNWTKNDDAMWKEASRLFNPDASAYGAPLLTTVAPGNNPLVDELVLVLGKGILAATQPTDTLKWVLQSNFDLVRDGGFVIQYEFLGDEMQRTKNILGLQWGDIFLHLSGDGSMRCYRYPDPGDMSGDPDLFEEFQIASPGDLVGKPGYFIIYPIAGFGLAIYHSLTAQKINAFFSSATAGVTRGHLIKLPDKQAANLGYYLLEASKVNIAINEHLGRSQYILGFHTITYPPTGTFAAEIMDFGFVPSSEPAAVPTVILNTEKAVAGDVEAEGTLRDADNLVDWTGGLSQQARVQASLSSTDPNYTPFLLTTGVVFDPLFATRDTTPKLPDALLNLEFSEDEEGAFEGTATVLMESEENRLLCERGDATFVVEVAQVEADGAGFFPEPEEEDWATVCGGIGGGLARITDDVEILIESAAGQNVRMYYVAKWRLYDLKSARTAEVHLLSQTALDRRTIGTSINAVLRCSALAQIDPVPAEMDAISLPPVPKGQNWRFGPRAGDAGNVIIRDLLLLLRRQNVEWRLYWDWDAEEWVAETKPRLTGDDDTWTLTPWHDDLLVDPMDESAGRKERWAHIGEGNSVGTFLPLPPEANLLQPFGLTSPQASEGERVPGTVLKNPASIGDPDSPDYLGRCVLAQPMFPGLQDLDGSLGINTMARRVYDAACRRRLKDVRRGADYLPDLRPATRCILRTLDSASPPERMDDPIARWIKRISVTVDYLAAGDVAPVVTYHLDSRWEGDLS